MGGVIDVTPVRMQHTTAGAEEADLPEFEWQRLQNIARSRAQMKNQGLFAAAER